MIEQGKCQDYFVEKLPSPGFHLTARSNRRCFVASPVRISPAEAREKAVSKDALLVCACDDGDQLRRIKLEGSITLSELRGRLPGLTKEQGLIFYCA